MPAKTVTVTAAKPFTLEGRAYFAGDLVTCRVVQALVLGRRGQIRVDAAARPIYHTRDLVAAPALAAVTSAPPPRRGRGRPRKDSSDEPIDA